MCFRGVSGAEPPAQLAGRGGAGTGQLARTVPSGTGMGLPAAVRDRVAAVHRGSALPERLRLYDGWAALYEQVPGTQKERERGRVCPR